MKYMISWFERPQGSPIEYENAQKRILEVFVRGRRRPISRSRCSYTCGRVGWAYVWWDCDDPLTVHKFCSMLLHLYSRRTP